MKSQARKSQCAVKWKADGRKRKGKRHELQGKENKTLKTKAKSKLNLIKKQIESKHRIRGHPHDINLIISRKIQTYRAIISKKAVGNKEKKREKKTTGTRK